MQAIQSWNLAFIFNHENFSTDKEKTKQQERYFPSLESLTQFLSVYFLVTHLLASTHPFLLINTEFISKVIKKIDSTNPRSMKNQM